MNRPILAILFSAILSVSFSFSQDIVESYKEIYANRGKLGLPFWAINKMVNIEGVSGEYVIANDPFAQIDRIEDSRLLINFGGTGAGRSFLEVTKFTSDTAGVSYILNFWSETQFAFKIGQTELLLSVRKTMYGWLPNTTFTFPNLKATAIAEYLNEDIDLKAIDTETKNNSNKNSFLKLEFFPDEGKALGRIFLREYMDDRRRVSTARPEFSNLAYSEADLIPNEEFVLIYDKIRGSFKMQKP